MKKQTALALAAVFSLSVAGTALAAPVNPFIDVPAKHWAYDSVSKLAQAGVISGYEDGTYKGERTMTRYEMAAIIGKALANSDKANAEMQRELDALQAEFSVELNNLGVRVDNLEKKMSNIKFTGEVRSRYDRQDKVLNSDRSDNNYLTRLRLGMEAEVADNITFHGRYEAESGWGTSDSSRLDQAYITGKLGGMNYSFGRQPIWLGQGLIADTTGGNDGLALSAGKDLKVTVAAFKKSGALSVDPDKTGFISNSNPLMPRIPLLIDGNRLEGYNENFYAANINARINRNLDVSVSYLKDKDGLLYKTAGAGLNYTGVKSFTVSGEYAQNSSDAAKLAQSMMTGDDSKAKAWFAKLQYAGAKNDKVGSFGIWGGYRNADAGFDQGELTTLDSGKHINDITYSHADNIKGIEIGIDYTVFKNGILTLQYNDLELKEDWRGSLDKDKKSYFAHLTYIF